MVQFGLPPISVKYQTLKCRCGANFSQISLLFFSHGPYILFARRGCLHWNCRYSLLDLYSGLCKIISYQKSPLQRLDYITIYADFFLNPSLISMICVVNWSSVLPHISITGIFNSQLQSKEFQNYTSVFHSEMALIYNVVVNSSKLMQISFPSGQLAHADNRMLHSTNRIYNY